MVDKSEENKVICNFEVMSIFDVMKEIAREVSGAKTVKELLNEDRRKIISEYDEKIRAQQKVVEEAYINMRYHDSILVSYSSFNAEMIGEILAELMTIVEGKNYIFKRKVFHYDRLVRDEYDACIVKMLKRVQMLMPEYELESWYADSTMFVSPESLSKGLSKIYSNGEEEFIVLDAVTSSNEYTDDYNLNITFYNLNEDGINQLIDFGKNTYLNELIMSVVQYRYENDLKEFTEEDMLNFLKVYLDNQKNPVLQEHACELKSKLLTRS